MGQEEKDAVAEVIDSGWLGNGPKCKEFETRLATLYGYKHCVTVNSATAALHLSLLDVGVGPGDEVILPALTFASTALAVLYCGAKVVFADVREDTLTIDWTDAASRLTDKTKAFIPVDFAGYPSESFSSKYRTVQDAAHSCGGVGYGDYLCLSFHPVKPLATGDGGAILTDFDDTNLRELRWCGISKDTYSRSGKQYSWQYDIDTVGYKCHWNDIQAAIGLVQLSKLSQMQARRTKIANYYTEMLQTYVECPLEHKFHTWHLYVIRIDNRNEFISSMAKQDIQCGVHYEPLTSYPIFPDTDLPVTDYQWLRLVSLPVHAGLTDNEVERVVQGVKNAL